MPPRQSALAATLGPVGLYLARPLFVLSFVILCGELPHGMSCPNSVVATFVPLYGPDSAIMLPISGARVGPIQAAADGASARYNRSQHPPIWSPPSSSVVPGPRLRPIFLPGTRRSVTTFMQGDIIGVCYSSIFFDTRGVHKVNCFREGNIICARLVVVRRGGGAQEMVLMP